MKSYAILWFGQLVSVLGSGLTNFGVGVWIYQKTGSATNFAFAALFTVLPGILMSPVVGAVVDRWDRKKAMLLSDVGAGTASLALALVVLLGQPSLPQIYALMAVGSLFSCFMWPAFIASMTLMVSKDQLGRANGMAQFSEAASMVLAPAIGGVVMVTIGLGGLVVADAISFAVAIVTLLIVRIPKPATSSEYAGNTLWQDFLFGFKFILARPGLVALQTFFLLINFTGGIVNVLITPLILTFYAADVLGRIEAFFGIGMLAGSLMMSAWGGPKSRVRGVVLTCGVMGIFLAGFGFAPPGVVAYSLVCFGYMFVGPIIYGSSQAIWQTKVPAEVQGRVFATRRMISWMMTPLAFLISGPLADRYFRPGMAAGGWLEPVFGWAFGVGPGAGYRVMFAIFGIFTLLLSVAFYAYPRLRRLEQELPDAVAEADVSDNLREPLTVGA